jgi:hypothetical protein
VRAKAVNTPWHANASQSLTPGYRICLAAGISRERIRRLGAAPDNLIYFFLNVDERLFHCMET